MATITNLQTNKITVIPAARKSQDISRMTSEKTLTEVIKTLGPNDGCFLLTNTDSSTEVEFYIEGYYVKVNRQDIAGTDVYVKCNYATTSSDIQELKGEEVSQAVMLYKGIDFYNEVPTSLPYLHIIKDSVLNLDVTYERLMINKFSDAFVPYVLSDTAPANTNKIWIDTTDGYNILKVYTGTSWVSIGAVAK